MAKSFRRTRRFDEDAVIPRHTKDVRRSLRRGKERAALRAEIDAALSNA